MSQQNQHRPIGCNLRPGMRPGFLSTEIGRGKRGPQRKGCTMADVRKAANESLAKRGIAGTPDIFDCKGLLSRP